MKFSLLNQVRVQNPLVHNITNAVAAYFAANGLLALGASPIMADETEEMADMAAICGALLINIGTLRQPTIAAMLAAGEAANTRGVPVVLDPVGAAATALRRETVARLLAEVKFAAIRGNAAEMAFIAGQAWQGKGVDAGSGAADAAQIAAKVAAQYGCIAAVSGATDYVSDGLTTFAVKNGTPLFPKITASGCLLGSVIAAFLAVAERADSLNAVTQACTVYAVAGERAAAGLAETQSGTFGVKLVDALAALTAEDVERMARVEAV
ncbi:hydroxyethylthiazole kinase [Neisseria chenwenguii]|uniref:hydroxyethylthiazole kinase n=1 Tax=Neisseria chenwenguii TaxID=1853278 RepID=UPI000F5091C2|nr:hydroxyethylthiazole kinase [Neisseria chenwenguii]ROV56865.1 hydroxyethylthiazole kinase [Neisseria chenwenguii]